MTHNFHFWFILETSRRQELATRDRTPVEGLAQLQVHCGHQGRVREQDQRQTLSPGRPRIVILPLKYTFPI